jgi:hypothetical protein
MRPQARLTQQVGGGGFQAYHAGLLAGQLGATYFIPTLVVPLLLVTHGLTFRILVQHQPDPAMQESRHLA